MKYNNALPTAIACCSTLLLVLALNGCADKPNSSNTWVDSRQSSDLELKSSKLLELHNRARSSGIRCGVSKRVKASPLVWSQRLSEVAEAHAADMARRSKLSHRGSKGSTLVDRVERSGYRWLSAAENIAHGYLNAESVMQAWLKSPRHCKNIVNNSMTEMASAYVNGYWVTVFASPISD